MNKKIKKRFYNVILVFAAAVFLFSAYKVVTTLYKYHQQDAEKAELIKIAKIPEDIEKKPFTIDWKALQDINKDIFAWIVIPDTNISYPIVQGSDNAYYLTHTAEKKELYSGAIFLDAAAHRDFSDRHTIIYGHNIIYGSMFAQLEKFKEEDFFQAHPYIYIFTPEKNYRCEIISFYTTTDTSPSYQTYFAQDVDYTNYLDMIRSQSRYSSNVQMSAQDQLLTLSTCSYEKDGVASELRYLLQAKLVEFDGTYTDK